MAILKVYIIIINWNGVNDTLECLESLTKLTYSDYKVIVVDNNSSNNDVEILHNKYGGFIHKIIQNKSNLGFTGGNNVGIKYALENKSDYMLLLNNDTVVEADFLDRMIEKEDTINQVGIITPMINYYSDKDKIWSAGGEINKIKASGFTYGYNKNASDYKFDKSCSFASGCCMLIKREVIEKIGNLDDKYFLYLEDTDYSQRAITAGYKILYVGSSKVYHKVFSTTGRGTKLLPLYYSTRNRLYFAKKNFGTFYFISFTYLLGVFLLKIISKGFSKEYSIIIYKSFVDFFQNKMGKTDYFYS